MIPLVRKFYKDLPPYESTAANTITVGRLHVALVALVWFACTPQLWLMVVVAAMMLLDNLDGWVARRWGKSEFGRQFDPIVDKVVAIFALAVLTVRMMIEPRWLFVMVIAMLVAVEVAITLTSTATIGRTGTVPEVGWQGKRGMFFRNCSIGLMLLSLCGNSGVYSYGLWWRVVLPALVGTVLGLIARQQYKAV